MATTIASELPSGNTYGPLAFRHHLLGEVLKRVKSPLGREELRLVTCHVLASLPHELGCRLAKRHGLEQTKGTHDWQLAEKARNLYRKCEAEDLARLIFEAMLIGSAGNVCASKDDDPLPDAASLYKVDARAVRAAFAKAEKDKAQKKNKAVTPKKTALKPKSDPK